jgi:hypothetical protein
MKVIGLLNKIERNNDGYVRVEIEGLRLDAGKLDGERLARWRRLLDHEVVAVVNVQWRQARDGKRWASRKLVGLYEAHNGEIA